MLFVWSTGVMAWWLLWMQLKQGQENSADFEKLYQYYLSSSERYSAHVLEKTIKDGKSNHEDENNATDGDLYIAIFDSGS